MKPRKTVLDVMISGYRNCFCSSCDAALRVLAVWPHDRRRWYVWMRLREKDENAAARRK